MKLGLALGSGGVRGFIHLGVIKILEENNIKLDLIAGSSIGSIVGTHYAFFQDLEKLENDLTRDKKSKLSAFWDLSFVGGLVRGRKIEKMLREVFGDLYLEEAKIPMAVVATDIRTGLPVVITKGKVVPALLASMAIPVVIKPVMFEEQVLLDGCLSCPVPVEPLRSLGADKIIGVSLDNCSPVTDLTDISSWGTITYRCLSIANFHLSKRCLALADVSIDPPLEIRASLWKEFLGENFSKDFINLGKRETERKIEEIKKMLIKTKKNKK